MRKIRDLRPSLLLRVSSMRRLSLLHTFRLVTRFVIQLAKSINFPAIPRDLVHSTHSLILASIIFDAVFARQAYLTALPDFTFVFVFPLTRLNPLKSNESIAP